MSEVGTEKKRKVVDPGNVLFVVYVGFVMGLIFLAMLADGYATSMDHEVNNDEAALFEMSQGNNYFSKII